VGVRLFYRVLFMTCPDTPDLMSRPGHPSVLLRGGCYPRRSPSSACRSAG
jgi:hypothetical protein